MKNNENVGLIECGTPDKSFLAVSATMASLMNIKKAFVFHESAKGALSRRYPQLEMADDYNGIFQDEAIQLVLISAPSEQHRSLIGAALKAQKQVQIV